MKPGEGSGKQEIFSLGAGIGLEGIESADHMVLVPRQDFL